MKRPSVWLAWFLFGLSLALIGLGAILSSLIPAGPGERRFFPWPLDLGDLGPLTYVAVGALIGAHRPRNPIGWMFCAIGLISKINGCALAYAAYLAWAAPAAVRAPDPLLVLAANTWSIAYSLPPAVLLYFPNGHLLSRRWQPIVWLQALIIGAGFASMGAEFTAGAQLVHFPSLLNLLGINNDSPLASGLFLFAASGYLLLYGLGGLAILLRFRRARGEERQQLKWFVCAALIFVAVVGGMQTFFDALHPLDPGALHPTDLFLGIPYALAVAAIPVAAGIAILKYRLYDIDLLIRRTLIYGVLTALLALVYLGAVIALQTVFTAFTGASRSELVTVLSTLVIAALFVPLRNRLQAAIDQRFYRRKYDAARTLAQFSASLRDEVNLENLSAHLVDAVDETMQPESVGLWLAQDKR
jgi:hypothetical protein